MDKIDAMFGDREQLVLETTLWRESTVLEKNMFPCKNYSSIFELTPMSNISCGTTLTNAFHLDDTPEGIEHYTLWSLKDMTHEEVSLEMILSIFAILFIGLFLL